MIEHGSPLNNKRVAFPIETYVTYLLHVSGATPMEQALHALKSQREELTVQPVRVTPPTRISAAASI